MTGTLPPLLDSVVGGGTPRFSFFLHLWIQICRARVKVLPTLNIDKNFEHVRFLILSLPNNEMSQKLPFAIQKAIQGISGEPKLVKKLRSGDLLIETSSALQTKFFLLTKTFLNCPLTVNLHRSQNLVVVSYLKQIFCAPPKQKSWKNFLTKGLLKSEELK
ncbi:uncharacterized protein TNCV_301191 [Trichonephila clavipes]|nr:uncharacterized protein TNCV_301191 [Trichonephila clavipes]